jgi:hypothetical protein
MNEPLAVFGWTLAAALAFGLLGAGFGALAGYVRARDGAASGTVLGRRISDALGKLVERPLTDTARGALVGAVDGFLFLAALGAILGLVVSKRQPAPGRLLLPFFGITAGLVVSAALFGCLALGIIRRKLAAVAGASFGGMMGAIFAARWVGVAHIVPGAVGGIVLGTLAAALLPRSRG